MKDLMGRFQSKVFVNPYCGTDQCWEWQDSKDKDGYGKMRVGKRKVRAHRLSYKLFVGDVPDDMLVCHKCDNPGCVNPSHLFLGSYLDNNRDSHKKGRGADQTGENNHRSKLTWRDVREIRRNFTGYWGELAALGKKYYMTYVPMRLIITGKNWKDPNYKPPKVVCWHRKKLP